MRTGTFLPVFLVLHVIACRQQEIDTQGQTTSVVAKRAERKKDTVTIGVGPGDDGFSFSAPRSGGTCQLSRVERLTRELDRTVLKVDETSNTEMIRHFIEIYLEKPGFWKEIALTPGDPDKRWEGYEVRLSMEKSEFVEGEPIPVTMNVTTTDPWGTPSLLLTPDRLRIQDVRGRDINLFHRPVSDFDSHIRRRMVFRTATDLTSFVEPYHGIELVNRFGPGTYSVTFHFSYGWPHQDNSIEPGDFAYPRVWGRKKSNTLTFTVRPAEDTRPVDIDALFEKAEQLVAESRANDAVRAYKEIVLNTADQQLIQKAIVQVLLIRSVAVHDEEGFYEEPEEPNEEPDLVLVDPAEEEEAKKPLRQRIDEFLAEEKEWVDRCLRAQAFRLSLLHVSEPEARRWYREYLRFRAGEFDWETPEGKEIILRWHDACGRDLFHYPMYRALLMEDLRNRDACPRACAEIYLGLPGEKDVGLLRELLHAHPHTVLNYFCEVPAPRELLADIARYFDDEALSWGSGPIRAQRRDDALLAFEKAVGLSLGFGSPGQSRVPDRIRHRDAIREILEDWRRRHSETRRTEQ